MVNFIIQRLENYPDFSFIPGYISAFLSAQYTLAKHPTVANQFFTAITSLFPHCSKNPSTTTLELWRIPDPAMILICLVLATSISSIVRHVEVDNVYSALMLIALSGTMGLGWALDLTADLVIFGLLPLFMVSALLVTRVLQNISGTREDQKEAPGRFTEKA